jgi:hypothetical protein
VSLVIIARPHGSICMEAFQILARVVVYQTLKTSFERVPLLSRSSQVSGLKRR